MDKITIKQVDDFTVKYLVFKYYCPKCKAGGEVHIEEEAAFIKKLIKCHKCTYEYIIESE